MTWKRGLIGAIVIALLLAGGVLVYRQFFAPASNEATEPVSAATPEGELAVDSRTFNSGAGTVSAEGQIVPLRNAALAFSTAGVVTEVLAAEGDLVEAGRPLARLDTADQEIALDRAQAALAQAQANLTAAQAGQIAAQAGVDAARIGVEAAEAELALANAAPRPEELALGESNVALAEARVNQAAAAQALVLEGVGDARLRAAEAELRAAEAQAIAPRLRLEQLRLQGESADAEALAQAERDYNAALAGIEAARVALAELQTGATSAQRQAASSGVNAAAAQRNAAQSDLDLLSAGGQAEQIAIAEAGIVQAEATLAEAEAGVLAADASVKQAEAQVTGAEAAVEAARVALDDRTLVAPFAGTVADIGVKVGEVAGPGVPAAILADFSDWVVETTDLTELDVVAVAVGDPAEVRADALPDEDLTGTVTDISTVSQELRGDITYTVTIRLDDAPNVPLRWGMTVFTTIDTSGG